MKKTTWWRNSLTGMGVLALVTAASPAAAQRYPRDDHSRDSYSDRQELGRDRQDVRGDWTDVRRVQQLMTELNRAQARRDVYREDQVRSRIHLQFRNEIAEARHDANRDEREVYRSEREGDRGGLRDDQNDFRDSRVRFRELNAVYRQLLANEPAARAHSWHAMQREDRLLSRFLQLTREDAMGSNRELNEDRRGM